MDESLSDKFVYVPGKMDLNSLPKDILILLLTRIEKDTIQHYENNNEELNDLRFKDYHCNCEHRLFKCDHSNCKAKALQGGKYDDEYENCNNMYECKCEKPLTFCDKHIFCEKCSVCEKCSDHKPCKYCKFSICPHLNEDWVNLPPSMYKSKFGFCDECNGELHETCRYYCGNCVTKIGFSYRKSGASYGRCSGCSTDCYSLYTSTYYVCEGCEPKKRKLTKYCELCKLKRHCDCTNFGQCSICNEELCPECFRVCDKCNQKICGLCINEGELCNCQTTNVECSDNDENGEEFV